MLCVHCSGCSVRTGFCWTHRLMLTSITQVKHQNKSFISRDLLIKYKVTKQHTLLVIMPRIGLTGWEQTGQPMLPTLPKLTGRMNGMWKEPFKKPSSGKSLQGWSLRLTKIGFLLSSQNTHNQTSSTVAYPPNIHPPR